MTLLAAALVVWLVVIPAVVVAFASLIAAGYLPAWRRQQSAGYDLDALRPLGNVDVLPREWRDGSE